LALLLEMDYLINCTYLEVRLKNASYIRFDANHFSVYFRGLSDTFMNSDMYLSICY